MTLRTAALTEQERTMLQRYARGAQLGDIARDLGMEPHDLGWTLTQLCGLNRNRARELSRGPTPERHRPQAAPRPPAAQRSPNAAPQPELVPEAVAPTEPAEPLERWSAWRCPACRFVGPIDDHTDDCAGIPVRVALLVVELAEEVKTGD